MGDSVRNEIFKAPYHHEEGHGPMKSAWLRQGGIAAIILIGFGLAAAWAGNTSGLDPFTPQAVEKDYETISLFGEKLLSGPPEPAALERLKQARRDFEKDPSEENMIWLGRRTAYLGRFREAIAVYGEGLKKFPWSYRLYRHRGHRYISLRQFSRAIADLEKAASLVKGLALEVEPDGVPNKAGRPVSNTQFNIHYHLGLAYYLARDFVRAEAAYRECLRWAKNDDSIVAVTDWLYLTLRQAGKNDEAARVLEPVKPSMDIIENGAYHERLLMFKGRASAEAFAREKPGESGSESAIRVFGLGMMRLWAGDRAGALQSFRSPLFEMNWAAFAAIATEVEAAGLVRAQPDRSTVEKAVDAWKLSWNTYDLKLVDQLFLRDGRMTYFSSEKAGRIQGFEALVEHHRGFGFVPGGKNADQRLWLEEVRVEPWGQIAVMTAKWYFDRDVAGQGPLQKGSVTFVYTRGEDGWRIGHGHFANDPASK